MKQIQGTCLQVVVALCQECITVLMKLRDTTRTSSGAWHGGCGGAIDARHSHSETKRACEFLLEFRIDCNGEDDDDDDDDDDGVDVGGVQ